MSKYKIVEFEDGMYAVQKSECFGLIKSYMSKSLKDRSYIQDFKISFYCKVKTIEEAKQIIEMNSPVDYKVKIKRIVE